MRVPLFKRISIALLNILFPPFAVMLICGPNADLLINSLLFLLAVFPSHIHGFYISMTYFNRKRKARSGIYPGRRRRGITSEKVNTGGVGWKEAEKLRVQMEGDRKLRKKEKKAKTQGVAMSESGNGSGHGLGSRLSALGGHGSSHKTVQDWDDGHKEAGNTQHNTSRWTVGRRRKHRSRY
ncbi:hypothetical protein B0A52_04004 [Exophiala mesophila]|uniref:Stress response RCI peptide n=1 Tax=Exophiala mesophila TaxID=212818 RepID=A0A438NA16_EXOME|nr:hypothetical protein B0A52_04004 [Exophiala mesophila]